MGINHRRVSPLVVAATLLLALSLPALAQDQSLLGAGPVVASVPQDAQPAAPIVDVIGVPPTIVGATEGESGGNGGNGGNGGGGGDDGAGDDNGTDASKFNATASCPGVTCSQV